MKLLVGFARIFVGLLFILSGFIKLNDPVGFAYKLQEYFGEGVLNLEFLQPFALGIAIVLVIFELLLGVMLLLGYARKFTVWSLLLMIIFFTFLTFYSAYFNKVTDCGCFGDAIPLTPWESFIKDVILLVLILILFVKQKYIVPLFNPASHKWIVFVVFIACLAFAYYVLMHLPLIDFRAYKEGVNIEEGMQPRDGELIPPIHDFAFYGDEGDATNIILNEDKVLVIVAYNLTKSEKEGWKKIAPAIKEAKEKDYKVIGFSASGPDDIRNLKEKYGYDFNFYFTDETAIKTVIRSNPGLMTLEKGTIKQKLHWYDASKINLK